MIVKQSTAALAVDRVRPGLSILLRRRFRVYRMSLAQYYRGDCVLPDFLIIGAAKSGTTTLFHMLRQHPGFLPPVAKEIQYFNQPRNYRRGEGWYRAHFPRQSEVERAHVHLGYQPVTGEATPAMSAPGYAAHAAALVPNARIIVTLRNPVDRAWSHYQHVRRHALPEKAEFRDVIAREQRWHESGLALSTENYSKLGPRLHKLGYVSRGQYAEQIEQWLRYFPREQFLFLNFDEWKASSITAAAQIALHVGLPEHPFEACAANVGGYASTMPDDCREQLIEHFRPWNSRLFELLGEDWGWPCTAQ